MKTTHVFLIGLVLSVGFVSATWSGQPRAAENAPASEARVLEMKSVPDGHFLVKLELNGEERLLNIRVKENEARCVKSSDPRFKELQGRFQLIGNGVFLIFFQNGDHRASQYWLFRPDGSAAIKEVPDRGEKQNAIPVQNDSLEVPEKRR